MMGKYCYLAGADALALRMVVFPIYNPLFHVLGCSYSPHRLSCDWPSRRSVVSQWGLSFAHSVTSLTLELRYIMTELRKPMDCTFYPACEPMRELLRDIPVSLVLTRTVLLQREAKSICAQWPDWEPKPYRE